MKRTHKKRGNAFDVCLLLLFLFSIGGGILRWHSFGERTLEDAQALVTLKASALHAESAECLAVGEVLYTVDGEIWGRVRSIQKTPTPILMEHNGDRVSGTYAEDERCDLTVTAEITGTWREELFLRGGRDAILTGEIRELYSARMRLLGSVLLVTESDTENRKKDP